MPTQHEHTLSDDAQQVIASHLKCEPSAIEWFRFSNSYANYVYRAGANGNSVIVKASDNIATINSWEIPPEHIQNEFQFLKAVESINLPGVQFPQALFYIEGDNALVMNDGFQCAMLLGYHSMSHTSRGVLCHTQSSAAWNHYWIDDRPAGEIAQMGVWFGEFDIPIAMVTGDDATCDEARDWLGDEIVTVQVKKGLTRQGALMLSPKRARKLIRDGAAEAVRKAPFLAPLKPQFPLTIRWQFKDSGFVDLYRGRGRKIDATTVEREATGPQDIMAP